MDNLLEITEEDLVLVGEFVENKRKAKNLFLVKFLSEGGKEYRLLIPVNDSTLLQLHHENKTRKCHIMVRSYKSKFDTRYKLLWIFG